MRGESFDVVIAGSGPAGAVAATVLPAFTRALRERGLLANGRMLATTASARRAQVRTALDPAARSLS